MRDDAKCFVQIANGRRDVSGIAGTGLPAHELIQADPDPHEAAKMTVTRKPQVGSKLSERANPAVAAHETPTLQPAPLRAIRKVRTGIVVVESGIGDIKRCLSRAAAVTAPRPKAKNEQEQGR